MKKTFAFLLSISLFAFCTVSVFSAEDTAAYDELTEYARQNLIMSIDEPCAPVVQDGFIVFTAAENARFVGIAFDYENFRVIHPFQRMAHYESGDEIVGSVLFYIVRYPKQLEQISYRLVIDGLWTTDPLNANTVYDSKTNTVLSTVSIEKLPDPITERLENGYVRFVYYGKTGQNIRLGGTFNNWDSYMYMLKEVKPGLYQIDLPLPPGTYYYNFYNGINAIVDKKNSNRVFSPDGKSASVITVK